MPPTGSVGTCGLGPLIYLKQGDGGHQRLGKARWLG